MSLIDSNLDGSVMSKGEGKTVDHIRVNSLLGLVNGSIDKAVIHTYEESYTAPGEQTDAKYHILKFNTLTHSPQNARMTSRGSSLSLRSKLELER